MTFVPSDDNYRVDFKCPNCSKEYSADWFAIEHDWGITFNCWNCNAELEVEASVTKHIEYETTLIKLMDFDEDE